MDLKIERGNILVYEDQELDMIRIARTAQKGKFSHLATTAGFIAKPQIIILLLDCTKYIWLLHLLFVACP